MQNKTEMVKHLKEAYTKLPISIKDAKKLKAVLLDTIPGDEANINLFVTTVTVGLVEEIASYENKKVPKQKKERWVKRLTEKRFIDRNIAIWAVECWCDVFEAECPKTESQKNTGEEQPAKKDDNESNMYCKTFKAYFALIRKLDDPKENEKNDFFNELFNILFALLLFTPFLFVLDFLHSFYALEKGYFRFLLSPSSFRDYFKIFSVFFVFLFIGHFFVCDKEEVENIK